MGMAASQARLLSLTVRMSDIELKAQNIEAQKIALATQKDKLYDDYCAALDATKVQVAYFNGASKVYVDANFNSLCTYQADRSQKNYVIKNNKTGKIYVTKDEKENYDKYGNDKYTFAWAMLGYPLENGENVGVGNTIFTEIEQAAISSSISSSNYSEILERYEKYYEKTNENSDADETVKKDALESLREYLYENYAEEIFEQMRPEGSEDTWDDVEAQFNNYANYWEILNSADQDEYNCYQKYKNDKYSFAWAMLGYLDKNSNTTNIGIGAGNVACTSKEQISDVTADEKANTLLQEYTDATADTKQEKLDAYRDYIYENYAEEIFKQISAGTEDRWARKDDDFYQYIEDWEAFNACDSQRADCIATKQKYDDKYSFAWAMMGYLDKENNTTNIGIGTNNVGCTDAEIQAVKSAEVEFEDENSLLGYLIQHYQNTSSSSDEKQESFDNCRDYLYDNFASNVFEEIKGENDKTTWDDVKEKFDYYVTKWEAIHEAGGCEAIDAQYTSGEEGNKWFQNMVEAGIITIMEYTSDGCNKGWNDTSIATSSSGNYLQEVQDETDLKKAEAEYEHELDIINRKDSQFDQDLSKLETERTAISKEIESIGKVRDDNVERNFGIFS